MILAARPPGRDRPPHSARALVAPLQQDTAGAAQEALQKGDFQLLHQQLGG